MLNAQHNYFRAKKIAFTANGNGTPWLTTCGGKYRKSLLFCFVFFITVHLEN